MRSLLHALLIGLAWWLRVAAGFLCDLVEWDRKRRGWFGG